MKKRRLTLYGVCTEQERATSASLRVACILEKKKAVVGLMILH